jgi:hypothetical protein
MTATWRGSHLAARHASYFHDARDFGRRTLCGLPLGDMTEGHVTAGQQECRACQAAALAEAS